MPPAPIRLVALDVDGTLLAPDGRVSPRTRRAVRAARARGIEVVLCTGRKLSAGVQRLSAELGLSVPAIVRHGAAVQDVATGAVLLCCAVPPATLAKAVDAALAAGALPVVEEGPRHGELLYAVAEAQADPLARAVFADWPGAEPVRFVPAEALYAVQEPTLVGACGAEVATGQAYHVFRSLEGVRAHWSVEELSASGRVLVQRRHHVAGVVPTGATKAAALAHYCADRGIALQEVMAVGDYFNDVEMLRAVGWGVAMGHAPAAVKEAASVDVPDNARDGAAVAIERFVI
jgi:5-amino-6-(5-phospho-D-ribitylamino)uracil phosphatase